MILDKYKKIQFTNFYKKFNIFSSILIILSIFVIIFKGLNLGVDFKGGTLIEVRTQSSSTNISEIRESLLKMDLGDVTVKKFGKENDYLVKIETRNSDNSNLIQSINDELSKSLGEVVNFRRVENVGPKVSSELLNAGLLAITLSLAAMLFYIWIRFEWQFSLGAIVAIMHDVIITIGIFSFLAFEVNLSIVAAVLTIVGYSMNDTVVIFDRIRENLRKYSSIPITEISNISINETLSRTLITSITTLLALISIFIFGGEILKGFSFAMIMGVIIGTYSSIFVATPILKYTNVTQKTVLKDEEGKP
ncbi:MAG: preprotein translocase subunit SecF [Pelagibacterales bacterium]|nr:preprotein translocase subunit SecF [Pelagibacterales bacterium]